VSTDISTILVGVINLKVISVSCTYVYSHTLPAGSSVTSVAVQRTDRSEIDDPRAQSFPGDNDVVKGFLPACVEQRPQ
jgi:hypothetical protein